MSLQISIQARDRKARTCRVLSMTVETDDYRRAYETALPELVKRLQAQLAGEPVKVETKKAVKPRRDKPAAKPKPKKVPLTGWAAFAADPTYAEPPPPPPAPPAPPAPKLIPPKPPTRRVPMARKPQTKQPDPFDDLMDRPPVNTAYLGMGRTKREPVERVKVVGDGLIKRTISKPKIEAVDAIFDGLEVE